MVSYWKHSEQTKARVPRLSGQTCVRPGGSGGVHPGVLEDLDELAAEGGDVLLDLVDVVLGDALVLPLALLHCHIAPD